MEDTDRIAGIDVAAKDFAVWVDELGTEILSTTYPNSIEGINACIAAIAEAGLDPGTVLFCMEHTGVYAETLCYVLREKGLRVSLVAPHKVKRSVDDPRHKTDLLDSRRLVEYARRYADRLLPWEPNAVVVEQINVLLRTRDQLVKQNVASSNLLKTLRRKWIQTPAANDTLERTIAVLKTEIKNLERQIRQLIKDNPTLSHGVSLLLSVPGVGLIAAANLLVLTSGFTAHYTYRQTAAYLGIAPRPYESGATVRGGTHARGYGPSALRKVLHMSVRSAQRCNKQQRAYFLRKKAEGKPGRVVLNNLANKQLRVMLAVLQNGQPYNRAYRSINPALLTLP